MTLRSRLAIGLAAIAIILVVPLFLAVRALERLQADAHALRDREFAASLLIGRLREGLNDVRQRENALAIVHDGASRDAMAAAVRHLAALTDSLERYDLDESARDVRGAVDSIEAYAPQEYEAALAGQGHAADTISARFLAPALQKADHAVLIAEGALRRRTQQRVEEATDEMSSAEHISLVAFLLAAIVAAAIAVWLALSISRPVTELELGMRAVADGDFDHRLRISATRTDEFGRLAESFDDMARQLAELDRLKAEFVSVASHELKTPVNVIMGYLELLQEGVYGPLTEKQHEILDTIANQSKGLARLTKQLLDVSRFEAGGSKLEPRRMQLGKLLDDLESAFNVLALQRQVHFAVVRRPGVPDEVVWDPDRINEVLGNLLSNAFKFTERGGEVELTVERVDGAVQMEVRDSGAGIPEAQLPHIFEKFYQADNQAAAAHAGTGLGLAIAKQIVDAHRGTIHCESTPGVGTTFTIVLPIQATTRRTSAQRAPVAEVV